MACHCHRILLCHLLCCLLFPLAIFCEDGCCEEKGDITFEEAVAKTLSLSRSLSMAENEIDAKEGMQYQSARLPNPIAGYSVENIFGNNEWQGWQSAESRYEIAQLIELGGKRGFRQQTAKYQYFAAKAEFEAKQLYLLNILFRLFTEVAFAQESLVLSQNQITVAEEVYKAAKAKVDSGKVSLIQQNKAEIELTSAQIDLEVAKADLLKNKAKLSSLWGISCPDFERVNFPFYEICPPIELDLCLADLSGNPEMVRAQMEQMARQVDVKFEKSQAIPDVVVMVGYKTLQNVNERGMILGASMPIPLFDQNKGNVQRAKAEELKAVDELMQIEITLQNKLITSYKDLVRSYEEAMKIKQLLLKTAEESFEMVKDGYTHGKFEFLDMLDSQKTLFEVKERYLKALLNYHQRLSDIQYLNIQQEDW